MGPRGRVNRGAGLPWTELVPGTWDFQCKCWESREQTRTSWSLYPDTAEGLWQLTLKEDEVKVFPLLSRSPLTAVTALCREVPSTQPFLAGSRNWFSSSSLGPCVVATLMLLILNLCRPCGSPQSLTLINGPFKNKPTWSIWSWVSQCLPCGYEWHEDKRQNVEKKHYEKLLICKGT